MTANLPSGQPTFEFQPDGQPTRAAMMRAQVPPQTSPHPAQQTSAAMGRAQTTPQPEPVEDPNTVLLKQILHEHRAANQRLDKIASRLAPIATVAWLAVIGAVFWIFLWIANN